MKVAVVYWKECIAGNNIASHLKESFGFKETGKEFDGNNVFSNGSLELYCVNKRHVDCDYAQQIPADFIVFSTTHRSTTAKPLLSAHPVGNFAKAGLGGRDRELVPTSARLLKNYLVGLHRAREELGLHDYSVGLEATHHGPFLSKPCVFIELGSSEAQWKDQKAGFAVAKAIAKHTSLEGRGEVLIGLGEGHYAPGFTDISLKKECCFGHICPQHNLKNLDKEMLEKMVKGVIEGVDGVVFDDRNVSAGERERIKGLVEQSGKKPYSFKELKP